MTDDGFREELLDALREADRGEVVVADQDAGSVRTLPEFPEDSIRGRVAAESDVIDPSDVEVRASNRRQYATLAFAEEHVEAILADEKTVTLRLPDAYDQAVVHAAERGAEVLAVTSDGQPFARLELRAVWAATARQVAGASLAGYPTALGSPDDVLRVLERHYGDELADAGPTTGVDVVHFDVVAEVIE